jgi:hypothetical protein
VSQLISTIFNETKDRKWTLIRRQTPFAIFGGFFFILINFMFIDTLFDDILETNLFVSIFGFTLYLLLITISLFFIAMGLFSTTTEIDLKNRKVRIIRKNFRGQQAIDEMLLDDIRVNATRMGITDANPTDIWIVKAGFFLENGNGEEYDVAIYSKETANLQDRNKIMIELYHFFFPDRQSVNENNIITNGTAIMLLSDKELVDFKNGVLFQDRPKIKKKDDSGGKWDNVFN